MAVDMGRIWWLCGREGGRLSMTVWWPRDMMRRIVDVARCTGTVGDQLSEF